MAMLCMRPKMPSSLIPVQSIAKHWNPFEVSPWGVLVSKEDVLHALSTGRLIDYPGSDDHAGRIAYLVQNETQDAIDIDVGCPSFGNFVDWAILDGNHRLAAAIYSEKAYIAADVAGELDHAEALFGVEIE